jgi:hypothetical protein
MGVCVGGIILYLLPSVTQLAVVNSPVFKVENNVGKLVFCREINYSQKLMSL